MSERVKLSEANEGRFSRSCVAVLGVQVIKERRLVHLDVVQMMSL